MIGRPGRPGRTPSFAVDPSKPSSRVSGPESLFQRLSTPLEYWGCVDEETDPAAIIALLDDEYAREILIRTSAEPMSANTLSEVCDASPPTIYRRLEQLEGAGLVEGQTIPEEGGHHYTVYSARLERFAVEIMDGSMDAEIRYREEHVADRFTRLYEELR